MFIRYAACALAILPSPISAEQTSVTVNQLDNRPLGEISKALGPVIVDGLELRRFSYGVPFGPFDSAGSAIAIFDDRSYYAENGVCVQEQWWFTFVPQVTRKPDRVFGENRIPGEIIGDRRDAPLKLSGISPHSTYWLASRDVEAEMPIENDGVFDERDSKIVRERAIASQGLCEEAPEDADFFGARDKEMASRGAAAFRRIIERLATNPDSLEIKCSYSAEERSKMISHIKPEELGGVSACGHPYVKEYSCLKFSVAHTRALQGTYVSVHVQTASDFKTPDDFTISLWSMSFVSH